MNLTLVERLQTHFLLGSHDLAQPHGIKVGWILKSWGKPGLDRDEGFGLGGFE
ncbi:MAG: hypothetical protein Ct9H90mP16_08240 [Candidatus Poseidoniales archaeon]|nr:MAG: hypothetical protein Ct9H90mP16_08240 [Candidatus Poseidoniales archaeon]